MVKPLHGRCEHGCCEPDIEARYASRRLTNLHSQHVRHCASANKRWRPSSKTELGWQLRVSLVPEFLNFAFVALRLLVSRQIEPPSHGALERGKDTNLQFKLWNFGQPGARARNPLPPFITCRSWFNGQETVKRKVRLIPNVSLPPAGRIFEITGDHRKYISACSTTTYPWRQFPFIIIRNRFSSPCAVGIFASANSMQRAVVSAK